LKIISNTTNFIKREEVKALLKNEEEIFILQQLGNNIRRSGNPFINEGFATIQTLQKLARGPVT